MSARALAAHLQGAATHYTGIFSAFYGMNSWILLALVPLLCILLDPSCWGKALFSSLVLHPATSTSKAGSRDMGQAWHCQQQLLTEMGSCGHSVPSQSAILHRNSRVPFSLGDGTSVTFRRGPCQPPWLDLALHSKQGSCPHASQRSLCPFVRVSMLPGKWLTGETGQRISKGIERGSQNLIRH